jgi:hypothetical protein
MWSVNGETAAYCVLAAAVQNLEYGAGGASHVMPEIRSGRRRAW